MTPEICHMNLARGFGGGERQTELLIRELAERNTPQRVILAADSVLQSRLADLTELPMRAVDDNPFKILTSTRGVSLLHVQQGRCLPYALARYLSHKTPYVVTRRILNLPSTNPVARRGYRRAAGLIAVSGAIAGGMQAYDPALNWEVIHDCIADLVVDQKHVEQLRKQLHGKTVIGHVGTLVNRIKGQDAIINLARHVEESHPHLHFMLVGAGKEEARMHALADGLGNLTFTGYVDDVGSYLTVFDLFVFPSLLEGFGSTLLDAMNSELPIVASNVGGIPELVQDGKNGLLVPPGDHGRFQDAVLKLCGDPELRSKMAQASSEITCKFSRSVMAERYLDVYEKAWSDRTK